MQSRAASPVAAKNRTPLLRYSVALLSFALSLLIRFALGPVGLNIPYFPFYLGTMLSGWYGGLGPGLLTSALSAAAGLYFVTERAGSLRVSHADLVTLKQAVITHEHYYPPLREWVENRIYPKPEGGVAVFQRYVTARKRAEEALRRSETYLAEGQRMSHTGSWAWDMSTGELFWSVEHFRICGVDPENFKLTLETARQFIHPEDRLSNNQAFERAIRERSNF